MARGALLASETESACGITRKIQVVVRAGFPVVEICMICLRPKGVCSFSSRERLCSCSERVKDITRQLQPHVPTASTGQQGGGEPQTLSGVVQFSALSGVTSISKRKPG